VTNQNYQLVVRRGPQEGHVFPLTGDMLTIGRDPMSDITLNDPEVSRQHARLARLSDGGFEIQDLGSTNGTFIDGNRLGGERVRLSPGQVLVLGSNVSLVLEAAPDQMATVVSARSDFDLEPFSEPEPEPEAVAPDFTEPEPEAVVSEFAEPEAEPEMEAAADVEEVVTDKLEPEMAPPVTPEEPVSAPAAPDHDATIIDQSFEQPSYPVFSALEEPEPEPKLPPAAEPEPLPAFEDDAAKTILDTDSAMPPPPEPAPSTPPPVFESAGPSTPPPYQASPPPPAAPISTELDEGGGNNRNRNIIIIAVVVFLLLCCCCIILYGAWIYGDAILNELNLDAAPLKLLGLMA
jgi:pSer/pThr/pTyr-binding forkhead associated (FHA) protein